MNRTSTCLCYRVDSATVADPMIKHDRYAAVWKYWEKNLIVRVQNKLKNSLFIVNIPLLVPKKAFFKKKKAQQLSKEAQEIYNVDWVCESNQHLSVTHQ